MCLLPQAQWQGVPDDVSSAGCRLCGTEPQEHTGALSCRTVSQGVFAFRLLCCRPCLPQESVEHEV